ncbi:WD domain-containing protein [Purpureocillium lavendulum]|uniref:WD domain-containing protein n=1 Tax=Purpureocillium lavendulum TaxID=1247861 RepID=A0AB34FU65_9HYPO|nr:WD domain-containing protein [Purpureocillium lavendulum]
MYTLSNVARHHFPSADGDAVYVLDLHRTAAGLASITSDQRLTLLDPARFGGGGSGAASSWALAHGGGVSALRVFDGPAGLVCTAGEDGGVAVWDLRAAGDAAKVAQFKASDAPILSMACSASTQTIAVGTELANHTASIYLWDVRSTPAARAHYQEVHSDDVTTLRFHPTQAALLLSGSTDGLVNVYDTRVVDEDELTLQTLNLGASVHDAGFLGGSSDSTDAASSEVYALSHDERFALYDVAEHRASGDATQAFGDLREVLPGVQYVAGVTPKTDGSGAVIGAGSQDKQHFELVFMARDPARQAWVLDRDNGVGLPGAHGEEIVRSFCFFDEEQLVFTAGEDGNIKAWRPGS